MNHLSEIELVMALDGELEPDELQQAVEHLAECDECRSQWEKLQATSAMVAKYQRALYPGDMVVALNRDVAPVLRFAFRVSSWQWGLSAAAAVVMLAVGVSWYAKPSEPQPVPEVRHISVISGVPNKGGAQTTASMPTLSPKEGDKGGAQNLAASSGGPSNRGVVKKAGKKDAAAGKADLAKNQYTELPFSDAALPLSDATVVRVSMPASVLRQAGVAVSEDNASAMVQADVVLGMDGLPRGIRLVQNPVANRAGTN